jgi:hypothetical protein
MAEAVLTTAIHPIRACAAHHEASTSLPVIIAPSAMGIRGDIVTAIVQHHLYRWAKHCIQSIGDHHRSNRFA